MRRDIRFIILLAITVMLFMVFVFPAFGIFQESKVKLLDEHFFYTPDEAVACLQGLGAEGRRTYVLVAAVVDMIYPIIYCLLFYLTISVLLTPASRWKWIAWLPGVLDALENIFTLIMLGMYPGIHRNVALLGGLFNGMKWIAVALVVLFILALLIRKLIFHKNEQQST